MREGDRWVVLDLGPAHAQTISFLNEFRCRLEIADLPASLDTLVADDESVQMSDRAEALLPARSDEPVDIVFCWDLLNYLERPALTALMARIAERARHGTLVHSLIVYADSRMPVEPSVYVPGEGDHLISMSVTNEQREAPRYTPDDLSRCMPAYRVERAVLLNNGMQEFLFRI